MSQNGKNAAHAANDGIISYRVGMIMFGVIAIMIAALPIDPTKVAIAIMARGAVRVGVLLTIGSMMIEMLRKFLEDGGRPHSKAIENIVISHAFILTYPLLTFIVLLGGSFVDISSTQLFQVLFFGGGAATFPLGVISSYMLDGKRGPAALRGCLWLVLGVILILAKTFV